MAWFLIKAPEFLRWQAGKPVLPTIVSVVDLKSNNGKTAAGPALNFLKKYGLDVGLENEKLYEMFGLDGISLAVDDQDSVYLTHDELKQEGYHTLISANSNGLHTYKPLEDIYFHDPDFGMYARGFPKSQNFGCDFCLWILLIMKPGVNDNVIADTKIGPLSWELACSFNPNDPIKAQNCARGIQRVRKKFTYNSKMFGETPRQYVNSPAGCREKQIFPNFGNRFWGNSYGRLLEIKKFWDPQNVFHHCFSIGSTDEKCCLD